MTSANTPEVARCNWCSRFRLKSQIQPLHTSQSICEYCLQWHFHAMDFLGGDVPRGCQACDTPWDVLRERTPDAVRMYVVPRDGINQMLCRACMIAYAKKRPDLYKGTQFWTDLEAA